MMSWLITSFEDDNQLNTRTYGFSFIFLAFIQIITDHPIIFSSVQIGMRIRVAVSSLIYRKSLRIMKATDNGNSLGKTVNMLSNDLIRIDLVCQFFHYIWVAPIQFVIVISITAYKIGPSTMAGAFLIVIFMALQSKYHACWI